MLLRVLVTIAVMLPIIVCDGEIDAVDSDNAHGYLDDKFVGLVANEQLLSKLLLPLRVQLASEKDVEELAQSILFMDMKRGQCPHPRSWQTLREVFGLEFLDELYGQQRLDALQVLLPLGSSEGDTSVEPLGQIELKLHLGGNFVRVSVRDFVLRYDSHNRPYIFVDIVAQALRRLRLGKRDRVYTYTKELEMNHAKLRSVHHKEIADAQRQWERKQLDEVLERKKRMGMLAQLEDLRRNRTAREEHGHVVGVVATNAGLKEELRESTTVRSTRLCKNIRSAIQTLQNQHVLRTERRIEYLRAAEKRECVVVLDSFLYNAKNNEDNRVCDSRCVSYCDGVWTLEDWSAHTGSPVSVVQVHALYHGILVNDTDFDDTGADYLDYVHQLVNDDVERGVFSTCEELCSPSPDLRSEMIFFAGLLDLLDDASAEAKKISDGWWYRARRAHLRIWSAAHAGSRTAIAALATMKEHGILSPSQSQVTSVLLSETLSEKYMYFWRLVRNAGSKGSDRTTPSVEKLLRFERFFALEHSWSAVNEPYITRGRLSALSTEIESVNEGDQESMGPQDDVSPGVLRSFLKAQLYIAGIKGRPRDLRRAECLLLVVLRKLRYTCDVVHSAMDDEAEFFQDGEGDGCEEHLDELRLLRRNGVPMGPCVLYKAERQGSQPFRFVARSKRAYTTVQNVLVLLSYVHLLNGLNYGAAARYAFLALELGSAAFQAALADLPVDAEQLFSEANHNDVVDFGSLSGKDWMVVTLFANELQHSEPHDPFSDLTRSGFLSSESLVLLAEAAFRSGTEVDDQYMRIAAEEFFGAYPCNEKDARAPCRVQWAFFLLREAARLCKYDTDIVAILGGSTPSPHRADPLLLMVSFLRSGRITVEDIREGSLFASPRYAPGSSHIFRPIDSDTGDTYSARLVRLAQRISSIEVPWRRGVVYKKNWRLRTRDERSLQELGLLRAAMQRYLEEHELNPLLVVSDVHDFVNDARWTFLQRFLGVLWDGILFFFTQTRTEVLEEQFAKEVLPEKWRDNVPADISTRLAASVMRSHRVRESSIALQLLSAALKSGEPDGFTFIFVEEMERGNAHLKSITHYFAEHVWGQGLTEVWMEEHKGAQWHHMKPKTKGRGPVFTVNAHFPFIYARSESRMELFTYIALKRVMTRQKHAAHPGADTVQSVLSSAEENNNEIVHTLSLCSGVLISLALRKGRPFPPRKPYEGMYLPVGSTLCLRRLLQHIRSTGVSPFWGLSVQAAELSLLNLLSDLAETQAHYYDLSLDGSYIADADASEGDEEQRYRKNLVEPWVRIVDAEGEELFLPEVGEGAFYNSRLHCVSGMYYAAQLHSLYSRVRNWITKLTAFVW
ncbi:hypothetical protein DQ04_00231010 [Trypanosoma grayi]|uniref:hypothetical protein n=1 Tax=Trypanosoma grayi TaxID=71804 RepID=UPI0004F44AD0|nr:hypothetical protein DQ04_00231010 [Trypanosoma grayi]KEG14975.1 hypothetical protein DQ04_00231010 [Trypanosoma grayi]